MATRNTPVENSRHVFASTIGIDPEPIAVADIVVAEEDECDE
jgi:hypothetical protein